MPIEIQDAHRLPRDFCIFFCWQDHLPKKLHRFLIRDALDRAITRVQDELPEGLDCVLRRDEATNDRAGSVDIANTILQKLNSSTVVVGDVTPVLSDLKKEWFYPNPNVMTEIGYAARAIGWNRILCLYNEATYKAEQLPFDIRHRRVTGFACADESQRKKAGVVLEGILVSALRAVIQEIGRGEIDPSLNAAAVRRQRDLRLLKDVMSTIHRPTLDFFVDRGQVHQLHFDCTFFWHGIEAIVSSSNFRFYDKELERRIIVLHEVWGSAMYYASNAFSPADRGNGFVLKPFPYWNEHYKSIIDSMDKAYRALPSAFNALLSYVHAEFPEIDMDETDAVAWKNNVPYIDGTAMKRALDNESSPLASDEDCE
jgi:hypothetical protein